MKKLKIILLIIFLFLIIPTSLLAENDYFYLGSDEVIDGNYYAVGNNLEILGTVNSDLYVLGGNAVVKGVIKGDVLALAGNVKISGEVDGDVRAVGGLVEISGPVGGNVSVLAGNLFMAADSEILGHLTFASPNVRLEGKIGGKVNGWGENIIASNKVVGDVNIKTPNDGTTVLLPGTEYQNNFYYQSDQPAEIKEGANVNGQVFYEKTSAAANRYFSKKFLFNKIVALFSLLVVGLLMLKFFFKAIERIGSQMISKPYKSLGWGFVCLVLAPIILMLLMLTIIGLPLALILAAVFVIILYVSQILVGLVLGQAILKYFKKEAKPLWVLITGLIGYEIIIALPYLGGVLRILLVIWALGATIKWFKQNLLKKSKNYGV